MPQVDDRKGLSDIIFISRNGLRLSDAPKQYGTPKPSDNHWKRWGRKDVFARMMDDLADEAPVRGR